MRKGSLSQWDQIREEISLLCVQWYISHSLTYSQLKTTMEKRGFRIDPQTINNLIHKYSSLAHKQLKEIYEQRKGGWRVVQIPLKIQGRKKYLYRALNAQGNTLDFLISGSRNTPKAKAFFSNSLSPDWKLNNQYVEKRKNIKRKAPLKLILFIRIVGLVGLLLFSSIYFRKFLENKQTQKEKKSNKDLQLPARKKLPQNRGKHYTALDSLSPSEKAFLDTISWAEGTLNSEGYRVLFGGKVIDDLSRHPEKCIPVRLNRKRTCSTAFGRYQIIDINAKNMSFEPENQDRWAINKLEEIGALGKIKQGDIQGAIALSCKVWSSFPCNKNDSLGYYNQPVKSMSDLVNKYKKRLLLYE